MFKVITDHPIAVDSDDHKYPEGIYWDNNCDYTFVESFEKYFGDRKIKMMDLGCAGGELICRMHDRGHTAIGLEGSDHCLIVRPEMVDEVGILPEGRHNWQQYHAKNLFTCDVTKPFTVVYDEQPFKAEMITCWDVIEHFYDEQLDDFFVNVDNHLAAGGLFVSTIYMGTSTRKGSSKNTPEGLNYHKAVHDRQWWSSKLSEYFNLVPYPFDCSNRGHPPDHEELFACVKK